MRACVRACDTHVFLILTLRVCVAGEQVIVGSETGQLAVWNFASCKRKFLCTSLEGSAVRVLTPSPALDVLAAGFADGRIVVHNIKVDQVRRALTCSGALRVMLAIFLHSCATILFFLSARACVRACVRGVALCRPLRAAEHRYVQARGRGRAARCRRHSAVVLHRPAAGAVPAVGL